MTFRSGARLLYRERTDIAGEARFFPLEFETGPFRVDALADGFTTDTAQAVKPGAETELILEALPAIGGSSSSRGANGDRRCASGCRRWGIRNGILCPRRR